MDNHKPSTSWQTRFGQFAATIAKHAGSPVVFAIAVGSVLGWAATGPFFGYSEGWQLIINTGTTICTFLMVFVIQNSQNRDGLAVQIKLDEIIRAVRGAKNKLIDLEDLSQEELEALRLEFARMGEQAREQESEPAARRGRPRKRRGNSTRPAS